MPLTPPYLLTLPREIRDIIYGYLTQDIDAVYNQHEPTSHLVGLRIERCPRLSVLLTHSRLYEEYASSSVFYNIQIRAHTSLAANAMFEIYPDDYIEWPNSRLDEVKKRTTQLTCLFDHWVDWTGWPRYTWGLIEAFCSEWISASCKTIRIGLPMEMPRLNSNDLTNDDCLPAPPSSIFGLQLRQRTVGYCEFRDIHAPHILHNSSYNFGSYLYSNAENVRSFWTEDEIFTPSYPQLGKRNLRLERTDPKNEAMMNGWREKREKDVFHWRIDDSNKC
ncbi:hypothetical protein P154DRAFT_164621 [Amniculicola lignicola CBS 123094]|uniref:Uncharacterized protein n=1 Tax=Amniculicola lignicola CBS 123094 TaxID=1392246 RepID=A0A6A5WKT7_9PLEO|nr:hypothetical protein P154DRAFT_164621 [Amniculicola lignicola CBS 123094]